MTRRIQSIESKKAGKLDDESSNVSSSLKGSEQTASDSKLSSNFTIRLRKGRNPRTPVSNGYYYDDRTGGSADQQAELRDPIQSPLNGNNSKIKDRKKLEYVDLIMQYLETRFPDLNNRVFEEVENNICNIIEEGKSLTLVDEHEHESNASESEPIRIINWFDGPCFKNIQIPDSAVMSRYSQACDMLGNTPVMHSMLNKCLRTKGLSLKIVELSDMGKKDLYFVIDDITVGCDSYGWKKKKCVYYFNLEYNPHLDEYHVKKRLAKLVSRSPMLSNMRVLNKPIGSYNSFNVTDMCFTRRDDCKLENDSVDKSTNWTFTLLISLWVVWCIGYLLLRETQASRFLEIRMTPLSISSLVSNPNFDNVIGFVFFAVMIIYKILVEQMGNKDAKIENQSKAINLITQSGGSGYNVVGDKPIDFGKFDWAKLMSMKQCSNMCYLHACNDMMDDSKKREVIEYARMNPFRAVRLNTLNHWTNFSLFQDLHDPTDVYYGRTDGGKFYKGIKNGNLIHLDGSTVNSIDFNGNQYDQIFDDTNEQILVGCKLQTLDPMIRLYMNERFPNLECLRSLHYNSIRYHYNRTVTEKIISLLKVLCGVSIGRSEIKSSTAKEDYARWLEDRHHLSKPHSLSFEEAINCMIRDDRDNLIVSSGHEKLISEIKEVMVERNLDKEVIEEMVDNGIWDEVLGCFLWHEGTLWGKRSGTVLHPEQTIILNNILVSQGFRSVFYSSRKNAYKKFFSNDQHEGMIVKDGPPCNKKIITDLVDICKIDHAIIKRQTHIVKEKRSFVEKVVTLHENPLFHESIKLWSRKVDYLTDKFRHYSYHVMKNYGYSVRQVMNYLLEIWNGFPWGTSRCGIRKTGRTVLYKKLYNIIKFKI